MFSYLDIFPFIPKDQYRLEGVQDVTILIKTLERKTQLTNLLHSIFNFGFKGPVIIADDSQIPYGEDILKQFRGKNIKYLSLPFDAGTAEGRNLMLADVQTEFFLLCDDDFIFEKRTRIPIMQRLLDEFRLDILGGLFYQYNRKTRLGKLMDRCTGYLFQHDILFPPLDFYEYYSNFEIKADKLIFKKVKYSHPITVCDLTHNFFLARTQRVRDFGAWNQELKGGEHQNFFIRAKLHGLRVATTRCSGVIHDRWTEDSSSYKSLRNRGSEYQDIALREFGITEIYNFSEVMGEKFGKN